MTFVHNGTPVQSILFVNVAVASSAFAQEKPPSAIVSMNGTERVRLPVLPMPAAVYIVSTGVPVAGFSTKLYQKQSSEWFARNARDCTCHSLYLMAGTHRHLC